ncbi:MAG: hypothetical protein OXE50_14970 [Chloroflexi bacterium]|nr:hypothetical protein [Chloroflexota bacterium]
MSLVGTDGTDKGEQSGVRLGTELGYGLLSLSQRLTGMPYAGLGLGSADARDCRLGLRYSSERLRSLTLGLEATRRETANDNAERGVMLNGAIRWYWQGCGAGAPRVPFLRSRGRPPSRIPDRDAAVRGGSRQERCFFRRKRWIEVSLRGGYCVPGFMIALAIGSDHPPPV